MNVDFSMIISYIIVIYLSSVINSTHFNLMDAFVLVLLIIISYFSHFRLTVQAQMLTNDYNILELYIAKK
jgi:hypothetical protein